MYADGRGTDEHGKGLTPSQVERLEAALKKNSCPLFKRTTTRGRIAHGIVFTLYKLGLRSVEVRRLRVGNVQPYDSATGQQGLAVDVHGKGGRWRNLKVFGETADYLKNYLQKKPGSKKDDAPLFPALTKQKSAKKRDAVDTTASDEFPLGPPVSLSTIQYTVRQMGALADISHRSKRVGRSESTFNMAGGEKTGIRRRVGFSPHQLRHTRLTKLAELGFSAFQIMKWAGLSQVSTAQLYVDRSGVSTEKMGAALD